MQGLVKMGLIVAAAGCLLACGQKGPLVLPDAAKRKHPVPTLPGTPVPKGTDHAAGPTPPASPAAQPT